MKKRGQLIHTITSICLSVLFMLNPFATIWGQSLQTNEPHVTDLSELDESTSQLPQKERADFFAQYGELNGFSSDKTIFDLKSRDGIYSYKPANPFELLIDEFVPINLNKTSDGMLNDDGLEPSLNKASPKLESERSLEAELEAKKVDRYIVKYKPQHEQAAQEKLQRYGYETQAIESDYGALSYDFIRLDEQEPETPEEGNFEVLILDEAIAPSELAVRLLVLGVRSDIEYIQPDYELSLSAPSGFTLELVDEPTDSLPEVTEPGKSSVPEIFEEELEENEPEIPVAAEDHENPEEIEKPQEEVKETQEPEIHDELEESQSSEQTEEKAFAFPVIVAIIDTGADITHPDIAPYIWSGEDGNNGWNFPANNNVIYDENRPSASAHGTHIAGIIARTAEEYGAEVEIMPLKVFENGRAYTSDIIAAVKFAADNGAQVINCSFGSSAHNPALAEALSGVDALVVSAVGNSRRDMAVSPTYPAGYRFWNTISVASVNIDDGFSFYSNYGENVIDLAARGREVESAMPGGGYGPMSGTSMSAGAVSAAAAVVLANAEDELSVAELRERIIETADQLSNLQNKVINGRRLNLENALDDLRGEEVLTVAPDDDFDVHGYQSDSGELFELFSSGTIISVSAGESHTLALKDDGTVWAWGSNWYGECENGETGDVYGLSQVIGLTGVVEVAAGSNFSLALKDDGTVWGWGSNEEGQLASWNKYENQTTPMQIDGLSDISSISAGNNHALALDGGGVVWNWGDSSMYHDIWSAEPEQAEIPIDIKAISAGWSYNMALDSDGVVWEWVNAPYAWPAQIYDLSGVVAISAGEWYNLALLEDGTVWVWDYSDSPVQVSGLNNITAISAGGNHSLAIDNNGNAWAWGDNSYGQLGDGTKTNRTTPVQVLTDVAQVAAGSYHTFALKTNGDLMGWGSNYCGQVDPENVGRNYLVPTAVLGHESQETYAYTLRYYYEGQASHFASIEKTGVLGQNIPSMGELTYNGTIQAGYSRTGMVRTGSASIISDNPALNIVHIELSLEVQTGTYTLRYYYEGESTPFDSVIKSGVLGQSIPITGELTYTGTILPGYSRNGTVRVGSATIISDNPAQNIVHIELPLETQIGIYTLRYYYEGEDNPFTSTEQTGILGQGIPSAEDLTYMGDMQDGYSRTGTVRQGSATVISDNPALNIVHIELPLKIISYTLYYYYEGENKPFYSVEKTGVVGLTIPSDTDLTYSGEILEGYLNVGVIREGSANVIKNNPEDNVVHIELPSDGTSILAINAVTGKQYNVALSASGITSFSDIEIKIKYDATAFDLEDICAFTKDKVIIAGPIAAMGITVTHVGPGEIRLKADKTIPSNKVWSGTLTTIRLRAKTTSASTIKVEL